MPQFLRRSSCPSQVDDLDGDGKGDELAFQIDLGPHQTRIVTISYGEADRILRLREQYPRRTNALFSRKIEELGWETERVDFRVYFASRNAIDIYGKRRPFVELRANIYSSGENIYSERVMYEHYGRRWSRTFLLLTHHISILDGE